MAITNFESVATVVSHTLHKTIKGELKRRLVELIANDVEPILEEYTRQIVMQVQEMRDPSSIHDIKIQVQFKLPNPPEIKNG